jgi:hypothetical protein
MRRAITVPVPIMAAGPSRKVIPILCALAVFPFRDRLTHPRGALPQCRTRLLLRTVVGFFRRPTNTAQHHAFPRRGLLYDSRPITITTD